MKKLLAILLTLCMLFGLLTVLAEDDIKGEWHLISVTLEGKEMNAGTLGLTVVFTFNEDGTGEMKNVQLDESVPITWANKDGKYIMTTDGEEAPMKIDEGMLKIEAPTGAMILSREAPAAAVPVAVPAEKEDAFFGEWKISKVSMNGIIITAEDLASTGQGEIGGTLKIEAGKASIAINFAGLETSFDGTTSFADGKLTVTLPNDMSPITIELMDNGELFTELNADTSPLPVYFAPAETPAG